MAQSTALVLGCGYTGCRVAELLRNRGWLVVVTTTSGETAVDGVEVRRVRWPDLPELGPLPRGVRVLHSVPVLADNSEATPGLLAPLHGVAERVVYLSTTSVYGPRRIVDERSPIAPRTDRERARVAAEFYVRSGPWSSLVLRPAAIYGPGRGVHEAVRRGEFRLAGDGSNYVSRIHVDDLAAIAAAALDSGVEGEYPVADDLPCTSAEIAAWCADLLRVQMPAQAAAEELHATRRSDRQVDGRAIRRLLALELRYPSYREGVMASIQD